VMTSNIGAELIKRDTTLGFAIKTDEATDEHRAYENMKEKVLGEMKKFFRPEFLNRIDGVVVFHGLSKEQIRQIVDLMLREVWKELVEKAIKLEVTDAAKNLIGEKGYDPVFGARPLRRTIQDMLEDPLSEALLRGDFQAGDTVLVDCEDDKIVIRTLAMAQSPV